MTFIEKLIEDTRNCNLDFVWKYSDFEKYMFVKPKDPLNGLTFSKEDGTIIFPNGFGLIPDKQSLNTLILVIKESITRTAQSIMKDYINRTNDNTDEPAATDNVDDKNNNKEDNNIDNKEDI